MDNTFPNKRDEPITNLPQKTNGLIFGDLLMRMQILLEIAVADLLDDIVVVVTFHDIQHPDHVFAFEQLKNLYLRKQCRL